MIQGCENALTKTGWGLCNYFIIGLCTMCTLTEASTTMIVVIITPLAACDLAYSKEQLITLNAILSLGMALGGILFGTLADNNGRKLLIPTTMIMIFCSAVGLSFSRSFPLVGLCIFILGICACGNNVVVRVYLAESLPTKRRGRCLALLDLMWIIGLIVGAAICWSLIPSIIRMLENEFRPSSWRVLAGIGAGPCLIMACATSLLPPSPRYLIYRRRPIQALSVFRQIYAINNSKHADNFPECSLDTDETLDDDSENTNSFFQTIRQYSRKTGKRIALIWSSRFIRNTLLFVITRLVLFPGLIWVYLWSTYLTEVASKMENLTLTLNETCVIDIGDIVMSFLHNCHVANNSFFEYSIIFSSSYALGGCLLFLGVDVIGRRLSIITSGLIGAISIVALNFASKLPLIIVLFMLFHAAYSIIHTTIMILLLENYPTAMRGTMMGLASVLPHLSSFFIKFLIHIPCSAPLYMLSSLLIVATIAAIPIPDLTNAPMQR